MNIFSYSNYKGFVVDRIHSMPKRGRGELQRIGKELRMHSSRVSHIFSGDIDLTLEQGGALCKYWGLSQLEAEYFIVLVQFARAGSKELKEILSAQAKGLRERASKLENRVVRDKLLSENEKAIFYSSWMYSGLRLASSVQELQTVDAMAQHFELPRDTVREILDFLVGAGLCSESNGRYQMLIKRTHLEASSILARNQHAHWRLKALARFQKLSERELAYTCPISINHSDQKALRELLVQTIETFLKTVTASEPPDLLACLNIDFFEY